MDISPYCTEEHLFGVNYTSDYGVVESEVKRAT